MVSAIHAVVKLPSVSGFAEDTVVNTFNMIDTTGGVTTGGEISTALAAFYNGLATSQVKRLREYLHQDLSRAAAACEIDLYNADPGLGGGSLGPPFFQDTFTLGAVGATTKPLPHECAVAITWLAGTRDAVSTEVADDEDPEGPDPGLERDRPKARRTGKTYLGPFQDNAQDETYSVPISTFIDDVAYAAKGLQTALLAATSGPITLAVWSRRNAMMTGVTKAFVDNAWDTQRRRGKGPNTRLTFTLP